MSPFEKGDIIDGKYVVTGLLGMGGMSHVYRCRVVGREFHVAVKVSRPRTVGDTMLERFEREARAAGRIGSPRIVKAYDSGSLGDNQRYLVLEHLRGESLSQRLKSRVKLHPRELMPIALGILDGLADAHAAGMCHRDLKPGNVFLTGKKGYVKLLDFGVSRFDGDSPITASGILLGTMSYMAPEQTRGARHADHRADLFSLGVIMFRALAGRTPHADCKAFEVIIRVAKDGCPPLRSVAPQVDAGLAAIIDKSLSLKPEDRFADAREFAHALRDWARAALATPNRPPRPAKKQRRDEDVTTIWRRPMFGLNGTVRMKKTVFAVMLLALPLILSIGAATSLSLL